MVNIRSEDELRLMRKSGQISAKTLKKVLAAVKPGITLLDLERIASEEIERLGAESSFKTVDGYQWTSCLTLNEEVVHGVPRDIQLKDGDILSIDLGALWEGWHTDTAWSVIVGKGDTEREKFLKVGEEALWKGIAQVHEGKTIGDIGGVIQGIVEGAGYSISRNLVGHGVGRELHEKPEVPGFGVKGTGLKLKKGMTLAIEVIYAQGGYEMGIGSDGWTVSTLDGSWGGLFEMTVIVGKKGAEVITNWKTV